MRSRPIRPSGLQALARAALAAALIGFAPSLVLAQGAAPGQAADAAASGVIRVDLAGQSAGSQNLAIPRGKSAIIDLPIDIWPLVKVHSESPRICEAFDGIVAGMEIVGGGTDLNDPVEQRVRFIKQRERQEAGAEEDPHPHDEEFVKALEYGMPPASGCGLGIDRLLMIMTESKTLRDVIIYPAMRELKSGGS